MTNEITLQPITLTAKQKNQIWYVISTFMDHFEEEHYDVYHSSELIAAADYTLKILDGEIENE